MRKLGQSVFNPFALGLWQFPVKTAESNQMRHILENPSDSSIVDLLVANLLDEWQKHFELHEWEPTDFELAKCALLCAAQSTIEQLKQTNQ
jgi:hypothetical protein